MCACRFEANSPGTPVDIEDYCNAYLNNMDSSDNQEDQDSQDVFSQLAQTKQDLFLAAELGKALLEKNEDLSKKNEQLLEEYTQKLDELTQEKHEIKLVLEAKEGEYENIVRDLQHDITLLRQELDEQQQQCKSGDRQRAQFVEELTKQNERLTHQLKQAVLTEEQMEAQLYQLRDQVNSRRTSMHEHVHQLEVLREEINMLTEKKSELERKISLITEERNTLAFTLEETQDRVVMLEKQKREQDQLIRAQEREMSELREQNARLQEQLEDLSLQASNSVYQQNDSLFSELEKSSETTVDMELGAAFPQPSTKADRPTHLHFHSNILEEDDDVECDDDVMVTSPTLGQGQMAASFQSPDSLNNATPLEEENRQLKEEMVEVYRQLRGICRSLQGSSGSPLSPEDRRSSDVRAGRLLGVMSELRELIADLTQNRDVANSPDSVDNEACNNLQGKMMTLRDELTLTQEQLKKLETEMKRKDEDLRRKTEELASLTSKLEIQHLEISKLQAARDRIQDQNLTSGNRDEVIAQARQDRDEAIEKRNTLQIELTKAKHDLMCLDQQLMEAIQQKVELSQQLEQWQMDMHELLDNHMTKQIKQELAKPDKSPSTEESPTRRRFSFWS